MASERFAGEITVASRIVDDLSSGLYESPAACLKELINNSYDADATRVGVLIKPDADRIIIEDNGTGMNRADFEKHFRKISESYKRESGDKTKLGRRKIGKIGIGFIAANEICDTMEIISQKTGSKELLRVEIHFDKMREDPAARRREATEVAKGDYSGEVRDAEPGEGFTQVILKRVRPDAKELFAGDTNRRSKIREEEGRRVVEAKSLYGLSDETITRLLSDPSLSSWTEFDTYSQNLLRVALNVPVEYPEDWIPRSLHSQVADLEKEVERLRFDVVYDGTKLKKPTVLHPSADKRALISRFAYDGKHVGAKGYFYAQHGVIRPKELQGLLIRIRHAAVGGYDSSFLEFPPSEGSIIQRWISAEVWADDRLEDALNIDRKTLRVSHPAYIELQRAVHQQLAKVVKSARDQLYSAGNKERKEQKQEAAIEELREFAVSRLQPIDRTAAQQVVKSWASETATKDGPAKILRKYSVVQLYDLVLEVAQEVLTPDQLRRFVKLLTDRIRR